MVRTTLDTGLLTSLMPLLHEHHQHASIELQLICVVTVTHLPIRMITVFLVIVSDFGNIRISRQLQYHKMRVTATSHR